MPSPTDLTMEIGESPANPSVKTAVVKDLKAGRAWSGEGTTHGEACTQAVQKAFGDRRAREYAPS